MTNTYDTIGSYPIIEEADLLNLASAANKPGDTRKGGDSAGKYKGKEAFVKLTSDSTLKQVIALDKLSSAAWRVVDGSANITPVNLSETDSDYSLTSGNTYAAGLLTTDGDDAIAGHQDVVLKAGKYNISGVAARKTNSSDHFNPKLVVSAGTDGVVLTNVFTAVPTKASPVLADGEAFSFSFTLLAASQTVAFRINIVDDAGDADTGACVIQINKLESM